MAIVGPITSIIIGAVCLLAAGAIVVGGAPLPADAATNPGAAFAGLDPLTTVLLWLGPVNLLLGIFNMVPGFPLDGGRVLRAILWAVMGNFRTATRWASRVGQAVAGLLIFTGIAMIFGVQVPFYGSSFTGGLWLAFIGWFLSGAAQQSYQQVVIYDALEGIPASRLMRSNVPTVPPTMCVSDLVAHYVSGTDERAFPVMDGDRLVGLVTPEDIRPLALEEWPNTTVGEIMTSAESLVVVQPQDDATVALDKLTQLDVEQVPVVSDGHLMGLVSRRDIVRWLQLKAPQKTAVQA
jgi:CBS domain-containing protein